MNFLELESTVINRKKYPGLQEFQKLEDLYNSNVLVQGSTNVSWYKLITVIFQKDEEINQETFFRNNAFVYSTLPASPTWQVEETMLFQTIEGLKIFKEIPTIGILKKVLEYLMPITNYSLTASSRLLHLFFPDICPTIHINIMNSWNKLKIGNRISLNGKNRIDNYLTYFEVLNHWVSNCQKICNPPSLVDLEFKLYQWNAGRGTKSSN